MRVPLPLVWLYGWPRATHTDKFAPILCDAEFPWRALVECPMDDNWLNARPHLEPLQRKMDELLHLADELFAAGQNDGETVDYAAFEAQVASAAARLETQVHQVALTGLDVDTAFVRIRGKRYRRALRAKRTYNTMAGGASVTRTLYRELGTRTGPTVDPIALRAGLVDASWLPHTARAMAHLLAQGTSREAEMTARELQRLPYSRSSFERVGHAVGSAYLAKRERIEPELIAAFEVPAATRSISVSVDRTSVAMEEPSVRREASDDASPIEVPAEVRALSRPLDKRTKAVLREAMRDGARPKIERNFRMAHVATVTLHDEEGTALHTIRYGRMPPERDSLEALTHRDVHRLMQRLRDDVIAIRDKAGELPVVLLADGAAELWGLFRRHLNKRTLGVEPTELVDAWHVAAAARFLEARSKAWPGSFRRWKSWLLTQTGGAERVLKALKRAGLSTACDETGRQPVGDALRYLGSRLDVMKYAEASAAGLPIGSGNVEAACKSLVTIRMKRPGARWKHVTGNEVLQLRALQLSDRWDEAMPRILRPLRKPIHVISRPEALGHAA